MKKLFFAAVFNSLFFSCFSQISSKALTSKTEAKDTSRKGKKPNTVPISTMANTTVSGNDQGMQSTTTVATTSNTTTNNNQPTTLDELILKVASLEASIDALNKRLPFENMAFVTIVADEKNLEGATPSHPDRYQSIRIDNPLCNGNPKAKVFGIREVGGRFAIGHIDYSSKDGHWHLFPSVVSSFGLSPREISNWKNGFGQEFSTIKDYDNFEDFVQQGSFLWAYPTILRRGDAVQLLIFTDLPNYNPAMYKTPGNQ